MRFGFGKPRGAPPPRIPQTPPQQGAGGPRQVPPDVEARFQKFREMLKGRPILDNAQLGNAQMAPQLATQMPTAQTGAFSPTKMKKGGVVKSKAKKVSSASKRADGCATKGKTKGRML